MKPKHWYWIAINGSSVALSSLPMRNPVVMPTPEQLFGFGTLKEAQHAQHVLLNAPIKEADAFLQGLKPDVMAQRIVYLRPNNPQISDQGPDNVARR